MARKPAVAGTFYESSRKTLRQTMNSLLCPDAQTRFSDVLGLIAPHAAYVYSGGVAGQVYSRVEVPDRVIILAPNHTGLGLPAAVGLDSPWVTPLGDVEVDVRFGRRLIRACRDLAEDELAHLEEHAIEVHLPFIHSANPSAKIVPICLRTMSFELCQQIGEALVSVLEKDRVSTLMVASSDMNHHEPQKVASRKDRMALDRVQAMDAKGLYHVVIDHHVSMCGFVPAVVMLLAAKALGARHAEITAYATSGDVNGDYSSVVGYAGVVVSAQREPRRTRHFSTLS